MVARSTRSRPDTRIEAMRTESRGGSSTAGACPRTLVSGATGTPATDRESSRAFAACSPNRMISSDRSNAVEREAGTSGTISTSQYSRCSAVRSVIRYAIVWFRMAARSRRLSCATSGSETSLQMTQSAPSSRASWAGRFRASPPSMSRRPSISTGENAAGIAMLARIARGRKPERSGTASPVSRSVATAPNGRGNAVKSDSSCACHVRPVSTWEIRCPSMMLVGSSGTIPRIGTVTRSRPSSHLRSIVRLRRSGWSLNTRCQSSPEMTPRSRAGE